MRDDVVALLDALGVAGAGDDPFIPYSVHDQQRDRTGEE